MKSNLLILATGIIVLSCNTPTATSDKTEKTPITGTWKLISGATIQKGDTTYMDYTKNQYGIKIFNDSHFSFLRHDLSGGKDSSAVFVAGGGRYTLKGNEYSEHLEFCNYRDWEDRKFDFTVTVNNDTLTQKGIEKIEELGVDQVIIEKYIKVN